MCHLWRICAPGGYKSLYGLLRAFENEIFWRQGIFFGNFDFKNGCKNEFEDNSEKSCSRISESILEPIGPTSSTRQPGS